MIESTTHEYYTQNYWITAPDGTLIFNSKFKGCLHNGTPLPSQFSPNIERPSTTSDIGKKALAKEAEEKRLRLELSKVRAAAPKSTAKSLGKAKFATNNPQKMHR